MPATVAVTGATGFIGEHLLRRLLRRPGLKIRALAHRADDRSLPRSPQLEWIRGDLAAASSLQALLEPGCTL
jgi:uncharacterized protein YbjT (DUF2867 family)